MDSRAVPAEEMPRRDPRESPRRPEPEKRMDAEALAMRGEVAGGPERIADDEDGAARLPERHLLPDRVPGDAEELETWVGLPDAHADVTDAKPSRDRLAVAVMAVEELEDRLGLAKLRDALVDSRRVHGVDHEDPSVHLERVRGALHETGLDPAEGALELVAGLEAQPPMNVS